MIRVVIVEDEALVRQGIRALLEPVERLEIVAEACDGEEAERVIKHHRPDVVLLDLRLPRRSGLQLLQALGAADSLPPCLALTTFDDRDALLEAIRAGARGYLRKDISIEQLLRAIDVLAAGGTFFQPALMERLLSGAARGESRSSEEPPPEPLTPRETEVMRLVAGGLSNREIAQALGTAEGTVKVHVSSVLAKLGVRDRVQAVLKVLRDGRL